MAKVYPPTTKYVIIVRFSVNGDVDEPDIVGAIFGQIEGLFGDEFDLRELQRAGKIGRLIVTILGKQNGHTYGEIEVPSSLDRTETALVAASIESVDRVGPYMARFTVHDIVDIREIKREKIIKRAKELLEQMKEKLPESSEIKEKIKEELSQTEIIYIGEEQIPVGPEVLKPETDSIILVEGKADLMNLMKHGIKNVVAVGGVREKIPEAIKELSKRKITIVFADGDKGGELFIKSLIDEIDLDYITRAPEGKEVEELTFKEIIRCLQKKQPVKNIVYESEEVIESVISPEEDKFEIAIKKVKDKSRIAILNVNYDIEKIVETKEELFEQDLKNKIIVTDITLDQKDIIELYGKGVRLIYTTNSIDAIFLPHPMVIKKIS